MKTNNTCPWLLPGSNETCPSGFVHFDTGTAPSIITIISCSFSCLGSILIIAAYFMLKDMRTVSQKIITLLAIADLISAVGYIVASANYLEHRRTPLDCGSFGKVCRGQATVTTYSSLVSFLWTVILAIYFFLVIVKRAHKIATNVLIYNVIAWGGPLAVVIPLVVLNKLGYSHFAASNWCFVKDDSQHQVSTLLIFVGGKFWEIVSYVVVSVLYAIITVKICRSRRQIPSLAEQSPAHIEKRLLAIPIIFIVLRMWGTIQFFFSLAVSDKISRYTGCVPSSIDLTFKVLGILQAIGDGGQGWGNAIAYIFLSPVMREKLIGEGCGRCIERMDDRLNRLGDRTEQTTIQYRGNNGSIQGNSHYEQTAESAPVLPGEGYKIKKYDSTTATEGFATGTDVSIHT